MRTRALLRRDRPASRGQALVETAILLPILLILLLGAIDFGRAFFGWVNLHQAARIGANFASTHPGTPTDPDDQADLVALVEADIAGLNCDPDADASDDFTFTDLTLAYTTSGGATAPTPELGDYATLTIECEFTLVTPLATALFGGPIDMEATSTFPVREGCINCPTPAPATPPPTPEQCRLVPTMNDGLSVAGARFAWVSAGFIEANFSAPGAEDTATVDDAIVTQNDPLSSCLSPFAIFSSTVAVTVEAAADDSDPTCATAPNVVGMPLADARDAWDVDFDVANFTADTTDDTRVVVTQTTTPASAEGVTCLDLGASIDVQTGDPWPTPPPPSCAVPSMINDSRNEGEANWQGAGFSVANFSPQNGNFTIRSQSLVGGTGQYQPCSASITVSANP